MSLIKSVATVGSYTIGSRILGFLREVLTASFLGAGPAADALVIAIKIPSFFRRLFAEGAFNAAFVPMFSGILASEGKKAAFSFAESIMVILSLSLIVLVLLVEFFLPSVIYLILPGFKSTPDRLYYAIEFTRITFPFILFISLTALFSGMLNSLDKFAAAASSPMVGNFSIIVTVYLLHSHFASPGYSFALGITICGLVQFLWVVMPILCRENAFKFSKPTITPHIKKFFRILAPASIGSGAVQINLFIGAYIASWLPTGGISYINYADRLNQLPLSVIGIAIATALLPTLSRCIRQGDMQSAAKNQDLAVEISLYLTLPAMVGLLVLAKPIISSFFEYGNFNSEDTIQTAMTLQAFCLGLPAYVLLKVLSSVCFAHQDTKTPIYTGLAAIAVDIVLSLTLISTFKHVGIALATAVSAWINVIFLYSLISKKGWFSIKPSLRSNIFKLFGSAMVMGGAVQISHIIIGEWAQSYYLGASLEMVFLAFMGVVIFIGIAHFTGAVSLQYFINLLSSKNKLNTAKG